MGIIINIENYTKDGMIRKDLSDSESELISGSEILINSAQKSGRGVIENSSAKCSNFNPGSSCAGMLKIVIRDIPNELSWICPECGSEGVIRNWRKSPLYLKSLNSREKKAKPLSTQLKLSKKNFELLKKISSSKVDLFIIFNSAVEGNSVYNMHIAEFDILRVLELIAEKIRKNPEQKNSLLSLKREIVESFYTSKTSL
jgi:hypothetical protein